ncbi:DNA excision repair protein ERCC-6-like isoform X2 [Myripristis murdjan]|uniref:DNA excision repair protein ERCC-6-like isoform X2 n=1 Tax=Myripristis murdjan TaxID=586833 RepID=UPI00117625F3|nr:DNA excision repair protein ERCC-6-like isoform X2 [Myripristis murdjan]
MDGQMDEISEKLQRHIKDGKDVARQGDISKALEFFKLAYNIHPSEKLKNRIMKIEELLAQQGSESEDEEFVNVNNSGLMLFKDLYDKLYDHQREGVAFLYSLYRDGRKGGILADDMGLGKTIQVISFLSGMYDAELVKHTLLVMPTSLIKNWTKEFAKWTPGMRVKEFHGTSKAERTRNLEKIQRRGGVLITTYQMLINNWQVVASYHGREFKWDYMILDEAHKIKTTSTKTAKSAYAVPTKNRVLLTGTPVQNNLREMWALFDFACQGTLLGTSKTFKAEYENPITRAREKDATPGEKALGCKMSENLMATINPYFLRRTKADVQHNQDYPQLESKDNSAPNHEKDAGAVMPTLTRKNDLIVWTFLSAVQEDIYRQFLSLDHIKELLMTTRSPLAELNILKKLCDHPRMLSAVAIAQLGLEESVAESQQGEDYNSATNSIAGVSDETLISESGKLVFLIALLERLREEGHRTLVFAHFRKVLDIIERVLVNRGFKIVRLDGTITQLAEREKRIALFQTDERYSVFLLTTQVGGVGITLTAANRVVIYDPSWNPATDAQAVDRAYRIGQTENVVIYRLITCGTVEEKIYRRQIFKDSLIRQTTGDKKNPFRYFSKQELKELFTLEDARSSTTQMQLQSMHSRHRRTDPELDEHIAHLHTMEMFGISDHDLMFSLDVNNDEGLKDEEEHQYINQRVQKAQELVKAESEIQMQLAESMADSTEPAWLRQPVQHNRERSNEKKPKNSRPSPPFPQKDDNFNRSPVLVELDQSGSGEEPGQQNQSNMVIDLTVNDSMTEEQHTPEVSQELAELDSPKQHSFKKEQSDFKEADTSVLEVINESLKMSDADGDAGAAGDASLEYIESIVEEDEQQQNGTSHSNHTDSKTQEFAVEELQPHGTPLLNKRLSVLQMSNASLNADASKGSVGFESLEGNFNLQLEDSDMFPDMEEEETDAQERKLLSQLQMEGSFNVDKSLCERGDEQEAEESINGFPVSKLNGSADNSIIIANKKKRTAVIYDSDEEEEDDEQMPVRSNFDESLQALGASTPKSVRSGSTPPARSRKSVGGNTSVASRRSLVQSIIEEVENVAEGQTDDDDGTDDYGEDDYDEHVSEGHSDASEEALSHELELEETNGETLNTEDEEEGEDNGEAYESALDTVDDTSGEEMASNPEESTSDPELASNERMDQCVADPAVLSGAAVTAVLADDRTPESEAGSYDFLVQRGKQCYSEGKLDDALNFFLRAIDIQPGDPEIQFMTIQLYRKLSPGTRN